MNIISLAKPGAKSPNEHTLVLRTIDPTQANLWEKAQRVNPMRNVSRSVDIQRSPTKVAFVHVVVSAHKGAMDDQVQPTLSQPPRFALRQEEIAAQGQQRRRNGKTS